MREPQSQHGDEARTALEAIREEFARALGPDAQPAPLTEAWGDDISDEREAELDARLRAWAQETDHGGSKGPFDKSVWDSRLTGADVFYLVARTIEGPEGNIALTVDRLRHIQRPLDFGYHSLSELNLERADLMGAALAKAVLTRVDLAGAQLFSANLGGADRVEPT